MYNSIINISLPKLTAEDNWQKIIRGEGSGLNKACKGIISNFYNETRAWIEWLLKCFSVAKISFKIRPL